MNRQSSRIEVVGFVFYSFALPLTFSAALGLLHPSDGRGRVVAGVFSVALVLATSLLAWWLRTHRFRVVPKTRNGYRYWLPAFAIPCVAFTILQLGVAFAKSLRTGVFPWDQFIADSVAWSGMATVQAMIFTANIRFIRYQLHRFRTDRSRQNG